MRVILRCDAGRVWGLSLGHAFRCLALAEDLAAGGASVRFMMKDHADGVAVVRARHFPVEVVPVDLPGDQEMDMLAAADADAVLFDGPDLAAKDIGRVAEAGKWTLAIDEGGGRIEADVVINGSAAPQVHAYLPSRRATLYRLGPDWAVLGRDFDAAGQPRRAGPIRRILVTFGGSDPAALTAPVCAALAAAGLAAAIDVVLGPAHREAHAGGGLDRPATDLRVHHDLPSLRPLMDSCDLAIAAAGRTAYELARCATPMLLVPSQPIEAEVARAFDGLGMAADSGPIADPGWEHRFTALLHRLARDHPWRLGLGAAGPRLIDGRGRERVVGLLARTR